MNDLETQVLQTIGENTDSPDVFTDDAAGMAPIRDSLNDAIEEITMLTGSVETSYSLLLRQNQIFYQMDFKRERFAWVTDAWLITPKRRLEQTDVTRLNAFNARWMLNSGSPQAYGQVEDDIVFVWPAPASELMLDLTCVVIPARYANDYDRVKLREIFKFAAVQYAIGEYYAGRGDAKTATEYHDRYLEKLGIVGIYPESRERPIQYQTAKQNQAVTE